MPFASMTSEDVAAFYELLDEYFESRKELFASWVNHTAESSTHAQVPAAAARTMAPAAPRMTAPPPPLAAPRASPALPAPAAPSSPLRSPSPTLPGASGKREKHVPANKYGVTIPSMADLKDPRFQQGMKFAGSAATAAGGFVGKHMLGQMPAARGSEAAAPPPASKPSGLAGKAMSYAQGRINTPGAAATTTNARASPTPTAAVPVSSPPAHYGNHGIGTATAQYEYSSAESGDLSFKEGDRITLISKESADWWKGEFRGRQGLFPASYVLED